MSASAAFRLTPGFNLPIGEIHPPPPSASGKPYLRSIPIEPRRHDSHQHSRLVVQNKCQAENRGISAKLCLPKPVMHYKNWRRSCLSILGPDYAAHQRRNTEVLKRVRCHRRSAFQSSRLFAVIVKDPLVLGANHVLENMVSFAKRPKLFR